MKRGPAHGQDYNNADITAAELLVNGRKLHFLAADVGRSLRLFSYEQQHPGTWRGKKLLPLCAHPSLPLELPLRAVAACFLRPSQLAVWAAGGPFTLASWRAAA